MLNRVYSCDGGGGGGSGDFCEFLFRFCAIISGKTRTQMKEKFILEF
jgi:hypothetical protein